MTKLQNLYRAAIAAEWSTGVPGLGIDPEGRWLNVKYNWPMPEGSVVLLIAERIGCDDTLDAVLAALERIARKEASK